LLAKHNLSGLDNISSDANEQTTSINTPEGHISCVELRLAIIDDVVNKRKLPTFHCYDQIMMLFMEEKCNTEKKKNIYLA